MPPPDRFKVTYSPHSTPRFAGCCYHDKTHQCPCYATVQADCPERYWQTPEKAAKWAKCEAPGGLMENVPSPRWYLYSGQADPTAMSFDAEPWDATCEAEGQSTRDTGLDFASWNLKKGGKCRRPVESDLMTATPAPLFGDRRA